MAFRDLRAFVERLEREGELVRVRATVDPELEITEIADRLVKGPAEDNRALLFESVQGSAVPVLINAFASPRRMALALGVDDLEELNTRLAATIDLKLPQGMGAALGRAGDLLGVLRSVGVGPTYARRPACQEVVETERPSLAWLPILKCWPGDAGRYITLGQVITRDPRSNSRNVGLYRLQVLDERRLAVHWQRHKGGAEHERVAREAARERIPIAVALGGDPAEMWCGSAPLPPNIDEYLLAGWLRGRPVEFARAITQPIEAPADADVVLEGYLDPSEHVLEGPFGDHTGFYTPAEPFPVMHITAITRRRRPIYPTTIVGKPPMEDYWMGKATERLFLPLMKLFMGEIVDVNMPAEGVFHNLVIVSIRKRYPGHAQKVMFGLWGLGLMALSKAIVVVDAGVDVQDLREVAWRVLGNVDWRRDTTIVDGPVDHLDHSALQHSFGGKIGVDATRKGPEDGHPRGWPDEIRMSDEIVARVSRRWQEYFGEAASGPPARA